MSATTFFSWLSQVVADRKLTEMLIGSCWLTAVLAAHFPISVEAEVKVDCRVWVGTMLGEKILEGAKPGEKNFQVGVCSALASPPASLKEELPFQFVESLCKMLK